MAAFIAVIPTAAFAEATPTPNPTYAPGQQTTSSLVATATAICIEDRPFIDVSVTLVDPNNEVLTDTVSMTMTGSGNSYDFGDLGNLDENGEFSTTVAWPGSSEGGWPGYEFINGEWVDTGDNYGWTRGAVTLNVEVNPVTTAPVSYPSESTTCNSPGTPTTTSTSSDPLAATGGDFDAAPLLFAAGVLIVIGGLTLLIIRRRTARQS